MSRPSAVAITVLLLGSLALNAVLLNSAPRFQMKVAVQLVTLTGTEMLSHLREARLQLEKAEQQEWTAATHLWRAVRSMGLAAMSCRYAVQAAAIAGADNVIDDGRVADLWPYLDLQESLLIRQAEAVERGDEPQREALTALVRSLQQAGFPVRIGGREDWVSTGQAVRSLLSDEAGGED